MTSPLDPKEIAWNILRDTVHDNSSLVRGMRLKYRMCQALKPLGPALPLALRPGDKPIVATILFSTAELLEKASGRVLNVST